MDRRSELGQSVIAGKAAEPGSIDFQRPLSSHAAELYRQSPDIIHQVGLRICFPFVPVGAQEPAIFGGTIAARPV